MDEMENGRTVSDNSSAQYATVREAMEFDEEAKLPSNQGIVYAPLSFTHANYWWKIRPRWTLAVYFYAIELLQFIAAHVVIAFNLFGIE